MVNISCREGTNQWTGCHGYEVNRVLKVINNFYRAYLEILVISSGFKTDNLSRISDSSALPAIKDKASNNTKQNNIALVGISIKTKQCVE